MKLGDIAKQLGGELHGDPEFVIEGVASLSDATPQDISLVAEHKFLKEAAQSNASAFLSFEPLPSKNAIVFPDPRKKLTALISLFHKPRVWVQDHQIHPTVILGKDVSIETPCHIEPYAVIGAGTQIKAGTYIGSHTVIGENCEIGLSCVLYPHVVLYNETILKDLVIIHPGAAIGSDGFGYQLQGSCLEKIPHIGRVILEKNVEVHPNTNIARGCLGNTVIGEGTKLDALVQIGHNSHLGKHTVLTAQVGLAGGASIGSYSQVGGQSGIGDIHIGDQCKVAARSGVTKNIPSKMVVSGFPAQLHREELKLQAFLRRQSRLLA